MQTNLFLNIRHRLVRGMRGSLVHDYYQMPSPMMSQHLAQEADNLFRADSFLMQLEYQPTHAIDCGNRRNTSPLSCHFLTRRFATRGPSLAQECRQRHVGLVLKIQQSPVFCHRATNFRGLDSHPLRTDFLIHFKVLSLRLLVCQTRLSQTPPDGVMRNRCRILVLNNSMDSTNRPQIRFKPIGSSRRKNNLQKIFLQQVLEQSGATASHFSLKPTCTISSDPTKEGRPINAKGVGNLTDGQATTNCINSSHPYIKGRVPSLVTAFHNRKLDNRQALCVNRDVADLLRRAISPALVSVI